MLDGIKSSLVQMWENCSSFSVLRQDEAGTVNFWREPVQLQYANGVVLRFAYGIHKRCDINKKLLHTIMEENQLRITNCP